MVSELTKFNISTPEKPARIKEIIKSREGDAHSALERTSKVVSNVNWDWESTVWLTMNRMAEKKKKTLGETRLSRGPNGVAYSSVSRGNTHLKSIWKMRPNPFAAHIQQYVTVASEIHTDKTVSEDKRQDMTI